MGVLIEIKFNEIKTFTITLSSLPMKALLEKPRVSSE